MPPSKAPASLVKEANEAHDLFMNSWTGMKLNQREFGRACELIELKQLNRYIRCKESTKGFFSFDAYVAHFTKGECSRQTIWDCKQIYRLTLGEHAIAPEVVDQIPRKNALKLARIAKTNPKKAKALAPRASKETVNKFAVTAQRAINDELPAGEQRSPKVSLYLSLDPRAADMLKETMEDFKLIPGAVRDGDRSLDLDSKAIMAICISARMQQADAIRSAREKAEHDAPEIESQAQETVAAEPETHTPDAAAAIAQATTEGRVIHRRSEARN